ncbi:MAG: ATP-binding protein [Candidatus Dormibacteria bacterium]
MNTLHPNPFRPGFAAPPLLLAGRDDVLEAGDEAIATAAVDHYTPQPLLLIGPRGVGKTVVLSEIARRAAEEQGWPRLRIEVTHSYSLEPMLVQQAQALRDLLKQAPPGRRFEISEAVLRAQAVVIGGEVRLGRRSADSPSMARVCAELAEVAAARGSGFVLTIDEMQVAPRAEMAQFAAMLQWGTEEHWPMVVVGAGLPTLRESTSDTEPSLGYLERAGWHELGLLGEIDTVAALQGPAEQGGRPMDEDAARLLARASGGYPYAIQLYGKHAWRASVGQDRVHLDAAERAVAPAGRELDRGLYGARWAQAPGRERQYLQALAELAQAGGGVTGRAIADQLHSTTKNMAMIRARLVTKGTLVAQGEILDFAIPGMAEYVRRQPVVEWAGRAGLQARSKRQLDRPGSGSSH